MRFRRLALVTWKCSMIGCIECITLYFVIPASVSGGCQLMVTLSLSAESTLSSRTDSGTKKKIRHKIINRLMTAEVILFAKWLWDSKPGHIGDRRVLPTLRLKVLEVSKCKINATELSNKVKFWPRGVLTYVSHIGYVPPQRVRFLRHFRKLCSFSSGIWCGFWGNYRSV